MHFALLDRLVKKTVEFRHLEIVPAEKRSVSRRISGSHRILPARGVSNSIYIVEALKKQGRSAGALSKGSHVTERPSV